MKKLDLYPFVKLFMLLAIGIVLGYYLPLSTSASIVIFVIIAALTAFMQWKRFAPNKYSIPIKNSLFVLLFIACGFLLSILHNGLNHKNYKAGHVENAKAYEVIVLEAPTEKTKTIKVLVHVNKIIDDSTTLANTSKAFLYIAKDSLAKQITLGSHLLVNQPLQLLEGTGNPGAFNYKAYCAFKGIYHQAYVPNGKFEILPTKTNFYIEAFLNRCRNFVISNIKKYIPDTINQGLGEALLIGYKDDLDRDLVQSYSNTGVVHVIAISGLHVGILYKILELLLLPLAKKEKLKPYIIIFQILFIWFFAFLTGASPSVLRSALMFSIIAAGYFSSRSPNMLNSLAASGFFLICIQPYLLWDVGFQLSYLAVLSIVLFYSKIRKFLSTKYWAINKISEMAAVTLSAQILTTPISVFVFHQFPNYFLLSNMVIVPLSSVVLILLLIVLCFSFVPIVANFLGVITNYAICFMNKLVYLFEKLPYALTTNININFGQLFIFYGIIFAFATCLFYKKKMYLFIGLGLIICFISIQVFKQTSYNNKSQIIVLNVPKNNYIALQNGAQMQVISDTNILYNNPLYNFYIRPSLIKLGNPKILKQDTLSTNIVNFKNYYLLFLKNDKLDSLPTFDTSKTILLFATNNNKSIYKLITLLPKNSMVIANQSNNNYYLKNIDSLCAYKNIPYYNTVKQGALFLK